MAFLEDDYLVALDGTGYFPSSTIHGASCLRKVHRNGSVTYAHQMVGAALIHPDVREVIPLMPEPIVKQDGSDKNDGERHAAKRLVAKLRQDPPHLKCIVTEDSLSSNAPHIETLQAHDLHDLLGVKEGDHAFLFQQVQAAEHAGRVLYDERHDHAAGLVHRFRFVNDVPLNESNANVRVHFIEYWETGGLDHGVGHFRPLRIMAKVLERLVLSIVRCFCVAQKQKGVADAMIEAVKCVLGCRHLLSQAANGVRMQVYVALIASLLISLWVERAPTKRTYEMCCFSLSGWASETELIAHLEQLPLKAPPPCKN